MFSMSPLFGVMKFEKEPPSFNGFGEMLFTYVQDAGGFAFVGLAIWLLLAILRPIYDYPTPETRKNRLISPVMVIPGAMGLTAYLVAFGVLLVAFSSEVPDNVSDPSEITVVPTADPAMVAIYEWATFIGGFFMLIGFVGPFLLDLSKLRFNRVYAIARLSFQEAVRNRVVWVFLAVLLLQLFPSRWWFGGKAEEELKNIIDVSTRFNNVLLVAVGLLLAAFSIPNDIKSLTIHTIVTKPVERFEIVLGRFFGYVGLITIALIGITIVGVGLIYAGNIEREAKQESQRSRVVNYGRLEFTSRKQGEDFRGTDVGKEDGYRLHIAGGPNSPYRAVWNFTQINPTFGTKEKAVKLEFAFDIYRTTKGNEGEGVLCTFDLTTWKWDPARESEYKAAITKAFGNQQNITPDRAEAWEKISQIAQEFGRYEWLGQEVFDYHTIAFPVPESFFKNALEGKPNKNESPLGVAPDGKPNLIRVSVKCETPSQFVGMAKWDLYFLEAEGSFIINYCKGAFGLWLRTLIVIALAISISTYLAGVVSLISALLIFLLGFFLDFIATIVTGRNEGGGPLESLLRLVRNEVTAKELDKTTAVSAVLAGDSIYRWTLRRVYNVIPDVNRYGWSEYVAQGFSIPGDMILINCLSAAAYTLPWLVAAYYLMKAREIAA